MKTILRNCTNQKSSSGKYSGGLFTLCLSLVASMLLVTNVSVAQSSYTGNGVKKNNAPQYDSNQDPEKAIKDKVNATLKENAKTVRFMENKGQLPDKNILYYFEGVNGSAYISHDKIRFVANDMVDKSHIKGTHTFTLNLVGSNAGMTLKLGESFATRYNFFLGNGASGVTGVNAAKDLTLQDVYPGVDLRLYSSAGGKLEFDWIIKPGADFSKIKLNFEGQDKLSVDKDGSLNVGLRFTDVKFNIPESYQVTVNGKLPVHFSFNKIDGKTISFASSSVIDPRFPLVIDPVLSWGTTLDANNSNFDDYLFAIEVDPVDGMIYCAGNVQRPIPTNSAPYDADGYLNTISGLTGGTGQSSLPSVAVVYRIASGGMDLVDLTLYGPGTVSGGNEVQAYALSLSPTKVFIGGFTNVDIPMAGSSFDAGRNSDDGYVAVFSRNLSSLTYATYLGSNSSETRGVTSVRAIDDNTFIVGMTVAGSFPAGYISAGAAQTAIGGGTDFYIAKFSSLNTLTWGTYVGGSSDETFNDIEILANGKIAFCGYGKGQLTEVNSAASRSTGGDEDGVIGVLTSNGTSFSYLDEIGGGNNDRINDVEAVGDTLYWTGAVGSNFPVSASGVYQSTYYGGSSDIIVGKVYAGGGSGGYRATYFGTTDSDLGNGIRLVTQSSCTGDQTTFLLVFGTVGTSGLPTQNINGETFFNSSFTAGGNSGLDMFFAGFTSNLVTLKYATYIGGNADDYLGATGDPRGANHLWVDGANVFVGTTSHSASHTPVIMSNGFDTGKSNGSNDSHVIFGVQFASLLVSDHSDAPATYGTPVHILDNCNKLRIGLLVDDELSSFPTTYASGDDADDVDDEDGISTLPVLVDGTGQTISVTVNNITNTYGSTANLYAWLDLNGDGQFSSGEFTTTTVANNSTNVSKTLTWTGVTVSGTISNHFVRIRLTTNNLTDNSGTASLDERSTMQASNGEVEDYLCVSLICPTAQTELPCQTQAAINTKYTTWLASVRAGGGSNGVVTNNSTGAPSVSTGGTATVTFTYSYNCIPNVCGTLTTTCQSTFTVQVASIILTPSHTDVNCPGSAGGTASISATGGTTPYTYLWSIGGTGTSISNLTAGTYSVTVTDKNGCAKSTSIVVGVLHTPVQITVNSPSICKGASANLTAANASTYTWTPSTNLNTTVGAGVTSSTTLTRTYTVTGADAFGCTTSAISTVTVNTPVQVTVNSPTFCNGSSANLTANNATSYSWSPATGLNATTGATVSANPTITTPYTVVGTDGNSCTTSAIATVTINPTPGDNAGADKSYCTGGITTIGAATVAGHTYSWSPSTGLSSSTVANPTANPTATTTYTLTEVITATGCSSVNSVIVTVNTKPADNAGSDAGYCIGGSASIGAAAVAGRTYSWNPATDLTSSTVSNPTANPTITTTYTLTETITATGCSAANTVIVTVNPVPADNAGADKSYCGTGSTTIGAATVAGRTYSWSPSSGLSSSTVANPTANPTVTTTYTLTETITATGCSAANAVIVTVNPLPGDNAGADKNFCAGGSTTIGGVSVAGRTYSWSPATGLSSSTIANPTANPASTTTYTLTETITATGCSAANTVIVTVNPLPADNAGTDKSYCGTSGALIGAAAVAGRTYSWSPATDLTSSTISNPTANPTATTTYTLTETITATGCSAANAVIVTVNPVPADNAGTDKSYCAGGSTTIGAASVAGRTYSWSPSTGLSSSTVANPIANPASTTTYTLTETITATGCSAVNSVIVTVNPIPTDDAGGDKSYCSGGNATIGAPPVAGHTYSWSPSTGLSSSTDANPTASPTATTTYTLTETITVAGCSAANSVIITVNLLPADNAGADKSYCAGGSTTIGAASVAGRTYSWSPSTGLSSSTVANPIANPASTTTYTLTETITATGCSAANTIIVTVNPLPGDNAGADAAKCNGSAAVPIGATATPGNTYSWNPSTGLSSSTVSNPTANPASTTTYTLTETITATGCSAANTVIVTINPLPGDNAGADKSYCAGGSTSLGAATVAGHTYSWSPSTDLTSSTVANPTANPTASTTYTLTETITATGCSSINTVVVTVNPLPGDNAGADIAKCSGGAAVSIGATAVAGRTYSWNPSTGLSSSTTANPTANPASTTTYTLTETITATGCSAANTVIVTVNPLPGDNAGADKNFCAGGSTTIGAVSVAGRTYSWSPATGLSSSTVSNPTANPASTTTYTLTETITATGCSSINTVVVTVNSLPGDNAGADAAKCNGGAAVSIGATAIAGNTYSWNPSTGLSSSTVSNPTANPASTTTYTLTETITATGCSAANTIIVTVNPLPGDNAGADIAKCNGSAAVPIGATATAGNTYSWNPSTGLSSSTVSNPTANPASTITYTLTETITATGCSAANAVIVTVNSLPGDNAGADKSYCAGGSTTIGAAAVAGHTYSWSPSTDLTSSTVANPTANPTASTTYTLTETITATGCSSINTVVVTINPLPGDNAGADIAKCSGGAAVSIGATATAGNTYSWSPATGLSSSTTANPTANPASTTTYTLTETITATGCSAANTVIVTVNPLPADNAGADKSYCGNGSTSIGTTATAGNTYSWSPATGLNSSTIANPTANPTTTTTYTLTETITATGCSSTNTVIVTANPLPGDNAGADKSYCAGGSTTIGATAVAGRTYSWSPSTGLSSSTVSNPTANPASTTTYTLTETITATGCSAANTIIVTVNPLPGDNAGADIAKCNGGTAVPIGATATAGNTYSWNPSTGLSSSTVSNPTANPASTTTYTLTETITATGCSAANAVIVTVNSLPGDNAGADKSYCAGGSTSLGAATVAGHTYSWSPSTDLTSSTVANPTANPTASTTYTLTETITATGCSSINTVVVTVNPLPGDNAGADIAKCSGGAAVSIGATAVAGRTYSWNPSTGLSSSTTANPTANPASTTTYTLTETITATGCSAANTVIVTVNPLPGDNAGADKNFCAGGSTTIGAVSVAGRTYSWSPATGLSSSTIANPTANPTATITYTLTEIITATGCSSINTVVVTVNPLPGDNAGADKSICLNGSVSIGVTAIGGRTYNWSPATGLSSSTIANPTANPTATTTYTLTETITATGCSQVSNAVVSVNPLPGDNAGSDAVFCKGGSASIGATAIAGHTYSWSPSTGLSSATVAKPTANPTTSTTYTLTETITATGCSAANTVIITVNPIPVDNAGADDAICNGSSASIGATSIAGRTYSWNPATGLSSSTVSNPTANPLSTTTYTLTEVITATGCSAANTVIVSLDPIPGDNAGPDQFICKGGSIILGKAGIGGHAYSWSPATGLSNSTTSNPTANPTATTTYTLTETIIAGGCTASYVAVVTVNDKPSATVNGVHNICSYETANLSASASAGSGTISNYQWQLDGSDIAGATDAAYDASSGGTYTVVVTNSNSCTVVSSGFVVNKASDVTIGSVVTDVKCYNANNGSIDITPAGGTPGYHYNWSNGKTSQDISSLVKGDYTVTVYDINNCSATKDFTLTQPAVLALDTNVLTVRCFGEANGEINLLVTGGTPDYGYNWSNGKTTQDISGLAANTYTVTVTDSKGCTAKLVVPVIEPDAVDVTAIIKDVSCFGGNDGSIDISVNGGTPIFIGFVGNGNQNTAYQYAWDNGSTDEDPSGLVKGSYSVTITDAHGCSAVKTYVINQPLKLELTSVITPAACFTQESGKINITVTGGTPAYTYTWDTGASTEDVDGLGAGDYGVTVTDANGCSFNRSFTVEQPTSLALDGAKFDVKCYGDANGLINLSVSGGTPGYTYSWSNNATTKNINGLSVGNYTATVTDANGCTGFKTFYIDQPDPLTIMDAPGVVNAKCKGDHNGSVNISTVGGNPGYTYLWSNSATTESIQNLAAGTYSITVTDIKACILNKSFEVKEPAILVINGTPADAACKGEASGSINISVSGGSPNYTYSWSNGVISKDISGLEKGTYTVTVTDAHGCSANKQFVIDESELLEVFGNPFDVNCNGEQNGSIEVTVNGGTAGYTFTWSNGSGEQTLTGIGADFYFVTVTDAHGCTAGNNFLVGEPASITVDSIITSVSCNGASDGSIEVIPQGGNSSEGGGTGDYTYTWSNGSTESNNTGLPAGDYTVTITDDHGCATIKNYTVTEPDLLEVFGNPYDANCGGDPNGSIDITAFGGTPDYTYSWSNGSIDEDLSGISSDFYFVTVTDSHGCTATNNFIVGEPGSFTVDSIITNPNCNGEDNGSIELIVQGGTPEYSYAWNNSNNSSVNGGITAGDYAVTITDNHGCAVIKNYHVDEPSALETDGSAADANCNGEHNGSVSITVTGGTPGYGYAWSNGSADEDLAEVGAGDYTVTVTDEHGCKDSKTYHVGEPEKLLIDGNAADANCKGSSEGSINITVSGGTPGYSYSWSNGEITKDVSGLTAGTYYVTATDVHGCVATGSFIVGEPEELTVFGNPFDANCNRDKNGSIEITAAGGTPGYTYSWSDGSTEQNLTNAGADFYFVTVTDAHGCTGTNSFLVGEPAELTADPVITDAACNGFANGSIEVMVQGGTADYTYSWSNGGADAVNSGLAFGDYDVTITDAHGCSIIKTYHVGQPAALEIEGGVTAASCNGSKDGFVNIAVNGGTIDYIYSWSNGTTNKDLTGEGFGAYTVTVTDLHGCSDTHTYEIGEPVQLSITGNASAAKCNGSKDGAIEITVTGGTEDYSYSWSNGSDTKNVNGLGAGSYDVTVTDAHGCIANHSFEIEQPEELSVFGNPYDANCNGDKNGSIEITANGGTPDYTYSWSNGSTNQNLANAGTDFYFVTVTDAHGCTGTNSFLVGEPAELTADPSITNAGCNGAEDGSIEVLVQGGSPDYTYSWSNGDNDAVNGGLSFGDYTVTVIDAHGCSIIKTYHVGEPTTLEIEGNATAANCNGDENGSVNITVSGGTPDYTYSWSNGASTKDITGVGAGTYTITITDANGCKDSKTYTVTQPEKLVVTGGAADAKCYGNNDGSVNITVSGGTENYTYSWNNGAVSKDISGAVAGTYSVTVTDAHACTATGSYEVKEPLLLEVFGNPYDANCAGEKNGSVGITVNGGTADYTYSWSNGSAEQDLSNTGADFYFVTVTDAHGCTAGNNFLVSEPSELTADVAITDAGCNGAENGSIEVLVQGGSPDYTYSWSNGANDAVNNGLSFGDYTVTVTDAHGCSIIKTYHVAQPATLEIEGSATAANCNGEQNGTVSITVTGGTADYTYSWSNGSTEQNLSAVGAGSYSVTVTDNHGCQDSKTYLVTEPELLEVFGNPSDANCNSEKNGIVDIAVSGGTASYTYSWSNGSTEQNLTGAGADFYFVTVTDAHGCNAGNAFLIGEPAGFTVDSVITDVTCHSGSNGAISVFVQGGSPDYTYAWSNGANSADNSNIEAGNYSVTITDTHNCSVIKNYTVNQPDTLTVSLDINASCFLLDNCNAFVTASAIGGTGNYNYEWSGPAGGIATGNDTINNLCAAGIYKVTVTDGNNCTATGNVGVTCETCPDGSVVIDGPKATCVESLPETLTANTLLPVLTYVWSNGATTQSIQVSEGGIYTVTVTFGDCQSHVSDTLDIKPQPKVSEDHQNVACHGACNGVINLTVTNVPSHNTTWTGPDGFEAGSDQLDGLCAGTYCYTVNANGCTVTGCVQVTEAETIITTEPSVNDVTCYNACNGTINLNIQGGTPGYTVNWDKPVSGENVTGLCTGVYCYTVYDANRCSTYGHVTVNQPDSLEVTTSSENVTCAEACNGSITVTVSGGSPIEASYNIVWNKNVEGFVLHELCAGTYCYTVTDGKGCNNSGCVEITQPDSLKAIVTKKDVICEGNCEGEINVSVSGGTAPYSIIWDKTFNDFGCHGVCEGAYCYTVTDNNGCKISGCVHIGAGDPLVVTIDKKDPKCYNSCDGQINISVEGGIEPYSIKWDKTFNDFGCHGVCAGVYCYTVTDKKGCSKSGCIVVNQPEELKVNITKKDVTCYGICDGSIGLDITGGTKPYYITWDRDGVAGGNLGSLCAGSYCFTITDKNGCEAEGCAIISQPEPLRVKVEKADVNCGGICDGSIKLTVSGGTPSYSIVWENNGLTGFNISELCGGEYCYTVTDNNGCTKAGCVTIIEYEPVKVYVEKKDVTCAGACDGQINLTRSGGVLPYTIVWDKTFTDWSCHGVCAGTYCYTVADAHGCKVSGCVTINQPEELNVNIEKKDITCNGGCDGAATLAITGGTEPYNVSWDRDGVNGTDLAHLCKGNYCYTITDKNGCSKEGCININQPAELKITVDKQDGSCAESCNGVISVSVNGGTVFPGEVPYKIEWDRDGVTDFYHEGLCSGTYCFTVIDKNGCEKSECVTISGSGESIQVQATHTDLSCSQLNGLCDGTITLAISKGTAPYTVKWSDNLYGFDGTAIGDLCPDTYCYSVTDANGCSRGGCVTINEPAPFLISSNCCADEMTCFNDCSGKVKIKVYGGRAPFTYAWNGPNGYTSSNRDIFSLCPGVYTVSVTDANGCTYDHTHAPIVTPDPIISNISKEDDTNCDDGICNGRASVNPANGFEPYIIIWSNGSTGANLMGLCEGKYKVTISDHNKCAVVDSVTITCKTQTCPDINTTITGNENPCVANGPVMLTVSPVDSAVAITWSGPNGYTGYISSVPVTQSGTYYVDVLYKPAFCHGKDSIKVLFHNQPVVTVKKTDGTCSGQCDGTIKLTVTGANDFNIDWSGPDGYTSHSAFITSLCAGTYCYTVNAQGCAATGCVEIAQPKQVVININSNNVTCNGTCNGTAAVVVTGGEGPFTYKWSNGKTGAILSGLCAATYQVTVTGAGGCTASKTVCIEQPKAITLTAGKQDATCAGGGCNGSVTVTVAGGTPDYTYSWNNGITANTGNVNGLCAGTYCVTVTDKNGCSAVKCATVAQPVVVTITVSSTNVTCNGASNGTASVTVNGGTAPFTYKWSNGLTTPSINGLCPGQYCVTVTSCGGCTSSKCVIITQPTPMNANTTSANVTCNGSCNGTITLSVTGGTAPYKFKWSNGAATQNLSGLCPACYTVTITDKGDCSVIKSVTITEPSQLALTTSKADISCNGSCNGSAGVTVSGGSAPYTYSWSNGGKTANLTGLCAATYCVTVTAKGGCSASKCVTISQPANAQLTINATNISCNGANNGSATLIVTGGTAPYSYKWSNGGSAATISGLCTGQYCVTVTGKGGCAVSKCVTITQPAPFVVTLTSTNATCNGACNGTATASVFGVGTYTYKWNNGATTAKITGLCEGTFVVTVTSPGGCNVVKTICIIQPAPLSAIISATPVNCINPCCGTATVNVSGGNAQYTYKWSNGGTTATIRNLCAGTYGVTVTTTGGCFIVKSVTIAPCKCNGARTDENGEYEIINTTGINKVKVNVYPNPFNAATNFEFVSSEDLKGVLEMYDITGSKVAEIYKGEIIAGRIYTFTYDAAMIPAGTYICRMTSDKVTRTVNVIKVNK